VSYLAWDAKLDEMYGIASVSSKLADVRNIFVNESDMPLVRQLQYCDDTIQRSLRV
jgi:hypothetical protein